MTEHPGDIEWFRKTGHCGKCGQPGQFCVCRESSPCGCRELHPMGSGLAEDALEAFIEPVLIDQDPLFGGE